MKYNTRKEAGGGGGGAPFAVPCVDIKSFVASLAFLTLFVAFWQLQPYGSLLTGARTSAASSSPCTLLTTTATATASPDATSGTAAASKNAAPVRLAKPARPARPEDPNKRVLRPYGSAAALFVQMGAYRGGPRTFAVVGLASKPTHVFGTPYFKCEWLPNPTAGDPSPRPVRTKAYKILPDWGYGRVYTVVVVNCTFPSNPNTGNAGGKLLVHAYYSTASRRYERFVGLEELRLRILTEAIRTGALARGWRNLWKCRWAHSTSLEVHLRSRDDLRRELDALAREPRPRRRLERLSLTIEIPYLKASELRRLLDYATDCGVEYPRVQNLTLHTTSASKLIFHLPLLSPALAFLSLRNISVSKFYNKGARPFHALEVIRLARVSFRREAFGEMMALCPSLLTLDLCHCSCNGWVFDRLPPNLRSLTISGCDRITSLDFVRVPSLRSFRYSGCFSNLPLSIPRDAPLSDLYIRLYETIDDPVPMKEGWNMDKLRKSLPEDLSSLSVLTICDKALTGLSVLSADGASAQLPNFNIHSLKELHLLMLGMEYGWRQGIKAVNLPNLYLFLKIFRCPNLERLFVQLPAYRDKPMEGYIDQVWEEPPEDSLDNLVMVKVMSFNWCPSEVQLVSFLLRKARSVRKILIVSRNVTPMDSHGAPEGDLSLLKEALVNGKIIFTESDNAATQSYHQAFI